MRAGKTQLQMCIRHVAEQEERIARQEVLIERLRETRSAILDDALRLLAEMHGFLATMRAHVARLEKYNTAPKSKLPYSDTVMQFALVGWKMTFASDVWSGRASQAIFDDLTDVGLASMYPAFDWSVCVPGHDGYPRARDLMSRQASIGPSEERQCSHAPGRPILHFVSITRRPRRENGCGYVTDKFFI